MIQFSGAASLSDRIGPSHAAVLVYDEHHLPRVFTQAALLRASLVLAPAANSSRLHLHSSSIIPELGPHHFLPPTLGEREMEDVNRASHTFVGFNVFQDTWVSTVASLSRP